MRRRDDVELEARIREYNAERDGLLEPGQPTETAHNDCVRRERIERPDNEI